MQIHIVDHHSLEVNNQLQALIREEFSKLEPFTNKDTIMTLTFMNEKSKFSVIAEILANKDKFSLEAHAESIEKAINELIAKIEQALNTSKILIQITGHHPLEVTESMRHIIEEKLSKLKKFDGNVTKIKVTLSIEKFIHKATANVFAAKDDIVVHASSKDMYGTIDDMIRKIKFQLNKRKEKLKSHHPHNEVSKMHAAKAPHSNREE